MKILKYTITLLLCLTMLSATAVTRKQYKRNLSVENSDLRAELAALEADYDALAEQVAALDSVTGIIFDSIESISTDTVSLANGAALQFIPTVRDYKAFQRTIDLMYPETAAQMEKRLEKLNEVIAASQAYRNLGDLLNKRHNKTELQSAIDSLMYAGQSRLLTKNQKREIEKLSTLAEKEWEDHSFLSELIAELHTQWPVIADQNTASNILRDYVYTTIATAYPGKKQFPAQYGYLNSVLSELTSALSDFQANSGRLADESQFKEWLLSLSKSLF